MNLRVTVKKEDINRKIRLLLIALCG